MKHIEGERDSNMADSNRMVNAASGGRIQIGLRLAPMVFPPELPWISVVFADRAGFHPRRTE
jgi:hypothetical protein